jgi:hypothetical protein
MPCGCGNLLEVVRLKDLNFVVSADRYIGKDAIRCFGEVDVVCDRTGLERLSSLNGGLASKICVLPMSFTVNQTCWPSGVGAMFGQKGLSCFTRA